MEDLRFIHLADVHLGYKQYGLEERADDFFKAFDEVIRYAEREHIKTMIVAGDLFHKKDLTPDTLARTEDSLAKSKEAGIDVIVVEGNHDSKHHIHTMSWLQYLNGLGLIKLIEPVDGLMRIPINYHMCNVWGTKYHGASISKFLEEAYDHILKTKNDPKTAELWKAPCNILMLHCGVIGMLPHTGSVKPESLLRFKELFDYVALGHIHKPGDIDNLIFNPGSTEHCSLGEADFEGGFYDVTITSDGVDAKHIVTYKRPMLKVDADVHDLESIEWDGMIDGHEMPIIQLTVRGVSEQRIHHEDIKIDNILHLAVVDKTTRPEQDIWVRSDDPKELERQVVQGFTEDDRLTALLLELKEHPEDDPEITYKKFEELV